MPAKIFMLLGLILCELTYGQIDFNQNSNQWDLKVELSALKSRKLSVSPLKEDFTLFHIEGLKNAQTPGAPSLPYYSFLVAAKAVDLQADVDFSYKDLLPGKALPAPLLPCRCDLNKEVSYPLNLESYEDGGRSMVEIVDLGDYRGMPISQVVIRPLLQGTKGIFRFHDLTLRLTHRLGQELRAPQIKEANKKMVLVGSRHLRGSMERFKNYKESLGFEVKSFIYEDIAGSAEDLRISLRNIYADFDYQYAVFFGFEQDIPPFRVETISDLKTPSDYPYFTHGGQGDLVADVFYGRMVGRDDREIDSQIDKIQEYDQGLWADSQGSHQIIGIASNEGWDPSDVDYMKQMTAPFEEEYFFTTETFFQDDANSNSHDINQALNTGARWLNYIGHGSGNSWSSLTQGEYHSRDVLELRAEGVKPIIIDVACQNGRFNNSARLGETFQTARADGRPIGSVAFFGGSVDISWDPPALMAIGINESLRTKSDVPLFQAISAGQLHLLRTYEDLDAAKENLLWYHLLGDPSMSIGELSP